SAMRPTTAMRPPRTPTSARNGGRPVPSTTVPPRTTRSRSLVIARLPPVASRASTLPRRREAAGLRVGRRRRRPLDLEHEVVDVAPEPRLARFERAHDRVGRRVEVLGGVAVRRAVAAADVAARLAHAQVDPPPTDREAVLATVGVRRDRLDGVEVRA